MRISNEKQRKSSDGIENERDHFWKRKNVFVAVRDEKRYDARPRKKRAALPYAHGIPARPWQDNLFQSVYPP